MKLELNIPEGREFEDKQGMIRKIVEGTVYFKNKGTWEISVVTVTHLLKKEITLLPWKPREGEKYYYIDPSETRGYAFEVCSQPYDKRIISRVTVYQTKEEVKAAVKELGWIVE